MSGPQDRWGQLEDPRDSTMDLPRISEPYARGRSADGEPAPAPANGEVPSIADSLNGAPGGRTRRDAPPVEPAPPRPAPFERTPTGQPPPDRAPPGLPLPHRALPGPPLPHRTPPRLPPLEPAPSSGPTPDRAPPRLPPLEPAPPVEPAPPRLPPVEAAPVRPALPEQAPLRPALPDLTDPGPVTAERATDEALARVAADDDRRPPSRAAQSWPGDRPARTREGDRPTRMWDGDRLARDSVAELRTRLERLPDGHPSSPYDDDGLRKPPVLRLKDLELPLTAEERPVEVGPRRDRPRTGEADSVADRNGSAGSALPDRNGSTHPDRDWSTGSTLPDRRDRSDPGQSDRISPTDGNGPAGRNGLPDRNGTSDHRAARPADRPSRAPRSGRDGSWEWRGRHLTPEQSRIADRTLSQYRAAEGRNVFGSYGQVGLTPAMRRVEAEVEHGYLVPETERFALKAPDRFKEKLARLTARFPGTDPQDLAANIHDGIRYTFLFEGSHYVEGLGQASKLLEDAGFQLVELRPGWVKDEYKGINSRWRDAAGDLSFEIQWHTPESWDAKQKTHVAGEKISDPGTPLDEVEKLRAYQRAASAAVPVPPGAKHIRPYHKER